MHVSGPNERASLTPPAPCTNHQAAFIKPPTRQTPMRPVCPNSGILLWMWIFALLVIVLVGGRTDASSPYLPFGQSNTKKTSLKSIVSSTHDKNTFVPSQIYQKYQFKSGPVETVIEYPLQNKDISIQTYIVDLISEPSNQDKPWLVKSTSEQTGSPSHREERLSNVNTLLKKIRGKTSNLLAYLEYTNASISRAIQNAGKIRRQSSSMSNSKSLFGMKSNALTRLHGQVPSNFLESNHRNHKKTSTNSLEMNLDKLKNLITKIRSNLDHPKHKVSSSKTEKAYNINNTNNNNNEAIVVNGDKLTINDPSKLFEVRGMDLFQLESFSDNSLSYTNVGVEQNVEQLNEYEWNQQLDRPSVRKGKELPTTPISTTTPKPTFSPKPTTSTASQPDKREPSPQKSTKAGKDRNVVQDHSKGQQTQKENEQDYNQRRNTDFEHFYESACPYYKGFERVHVTTNSRNEVVKLKHPQYFEVTRCRYDPGTRNITTESSIQEVPRLTRHCADCCYGVDHIHFHSKCETVKSFVSVIVSKPDPEHPGEYLRNYQLDYIPLDTSCKCSVAQKSHSRLPGR